MLRLNQTTDHGDAAGSLNSQSYLETPITVIQ